MQSKNFDIEILNINHVQLRVDYYLSNKEHLEIWHPTTPKGFYTFKYQEKKINEQLDENLQIGIIIGLIYANEKYDNEREIISISLANVTHTHPYNYLSVLTLANIISYTIINKYNTLLYLNLPLIFIQDFTVNITFTL